MSGKPSESNEWELEDAAKKEVADWRPPPVKPEEVSLKLSKMTLAQKVLIHMQVGHDAFVIMMALKLRPSELRRVLTGPEMKRTLSVSSMVAAAELRIRLGLHVLDVPDTLDKLRECEKPEVRHRACTSIVEQLAALDADFMPPRAIAAKRRRQRRATLPPAAAAERLVASVQTKHMLTAALQLTSASSSTDARSPASPALPHTTDKPELTTK